MRIFARAGTVRRDLGDGNWVELKASLSMADQAAIRDAGTRIHVDTKTRESSFDFSMGAANAEMLKRSIVAWGGPAFCQHDHENMGGPHDDAGLSNGCKARPINRSTLDELDQEAGDYLVAAINELSPTPASGGDKDREGANP